MRVPGKTPQINLRRFFQAFPNYPGNAGPRSVKLCTRRLGLPCNETEVDAIFD
jgi:hypothetical protein